MTDPTVVVGTAGHIDHGKTTLLRALTAIDADRLPEERRRGMTIDVGYAHLDLPDGTSIDFVDVPGHDRLVGNMLVGAGEIDAAMVVVAADDGPRAQTREHLELLDALGIRHGLAVVTKIDAVPEARVAEVIDEVRTLLDATGLAGSPVVAASGTAGHGIERLRDALIAVRTRAMPTRRDGGPDLAIDRVFSAKGRGTVVTGTLRGGAIATGDELVVRPGGAIVRVREVQVHGRPVECASGGRTALLLGGTDGLELRRGQVLATRGRLTETSRILVELRPAVDLALGRRAHPPADGARLRLHVRTEQVGALVVRSPREEAELGVDAVVAILRLERPVACEAGDRFALRDPTGSSTAHGGLVLDAAPPRGISRRRTTPERLRALAEAARRHASGEARLALHGILGDGPEVSVAPDVRAALRDAAIASVQAHHADEPESAGPTLEAVRRAVASVARRLATATRDLADAAAATTIGALVDEGLLVRNGDRVRDAARDPGLPAAVRGSMDRLEAALATASPPPLAEAARMAGCPPDGIRALEAERRIVRLGDDLAWSATTYRELARTAVTMAAAGPLTPAAFRDATGSSRKYVLAILEDLDRRELLRRTDAGHVLGRRSLQRARPAHPTTPAVP